MKFNLPVFVFSNGDMRQELCLEKVVDDLAFIQVMVSWIGIIHALEQKLNMYKNNNNLIFQLAAPEIIVIAPDVRMTFVDQIGMLGNLF